MPIYKLPTELVRKILLFLKEYNMPPLSSKPEIFGLELNSYQYRWIIDISHVSRSFRNISLEYPDLWTNIPLYSRELTALFLERSGQTSQLTWIVGDKDPVFKNLNLWTTAHLLRIKELMNKYLPQIRVLQFCLPSLPLILILPELDSPLSSLQELYLVHPDGRCTTNTTFGGLFRSDFISSASSLQVLQLGGLWTTDLSILPFTHLRLLKLNFGKSLVDLNFPSLIGLLARNPRLEELVFLNLMHYSNTPIQPLVRLPNLRRLILNGDLCALSVFVRTLAVSEFVFISLYTTVDSHTDLSRAALEIQQAIQCTARPILHAATTNIHQLSISHQYSWGMELLFILRPEVCYTSYCPIRCPHGVTTIRLKLPNASVDAARTLIDHCQDLPISDINNISLHDGPLSEFDGTATKAKDTFFVIGNPSLENLRWFLPFTLITDDKYRRCFPPIRIISIKDSDFEGQDYRETQAFVGVLVDLVAMCKPYSVHLQKIEITNCKNVTSEMVATLQEFVETVTWDGRS